MILIGLVVWSMISAQSKWKYEKLGLGEHEKGDYKEAIKHYTLGIKSDPGNASLYNNRGLAHFKLKEYDKAISDLEKAIALNAASYSKECPRIYPMALKNLGVVYWKMGKRDKAKGYFKKAVKLFEEREEYYAKDIKEALKTGDISGLLI